MNIQVGKYYKLQDGGSIYVQQDTLRGTRDSDNPHDKFTRFKCATNTGEIMFYSERGIAAHSETTPNPRHSVTNEIY